MDNQSSKAHDSDTSRLGYSSGESYQKYRDAMNKKAHPSLEEVTEGKRVAFYRLTNDPNDSDMYYKLMTQYHPSWKTVTYYEDNRGDYDSWKQRPERTRLIEDAKAGKVDVIVVRNLSRWARDTVFTVKSINELANLPHPVGVYFVTENMYSLADSDATAFCLMDILSMEEMSRVS